MKKFENDFDSQERDIVTNSFKTARFSTVYKNPAADNQFLSFEFASTTTPTENFSAYYSNETHTSFECLLSGSMIIEKDGKLYKANTGDTYMLKKGCGANYYSADSQAISKIWFSVQGTLLDSLLNAYNLTDDVAVFHADTSALMKKIHDYLMSDTNSDYVINKLSLNLHEFIIALSNSTQSIDTSFQPGFSLADSFKNFCDSRKFFTYSLNTFAIRFRTTEKQIIYAFKKKYGMTPYAYFTKTRIEYAKELLSITSLSVKEIADKLSYSSPSSFSHAFKKYTALYPEQYRKAIQKGE